MSTITAVVRYTRRPLAALTAVFVCVLLPAWAICAVDAYTWSRAGDGAVPWTPLGSVTWTWSHAWPWALAVTLWCVVVWVATAEQARRGARRRWVPFGITAAILVLWSTLGLVGATTRDLFAVDQDPSAWATTGYSLGWPGPADHAPLTWSAGDRVALSPDARFFHLPDVTAHIRLPIVTPLVALVAVWFVALVAGRGVSISSTTSTWPSRALAVVALGLPAVAALGAATWAASGDVGGSWDRAHVALDLRPVALAMLVGVLTVGAGRVGWAVTVAMITPWTLRHVHSWWEQQVDQIGVVALGGLGAVLLASCIVPAARAVGRLDGAPEQPAEHTVVVS
ncbi:hypothetical protein [Cellulomonas sp. HZM]|uniref:hypothetical protein n=1 Tax=Cellulomonas sp. HZM TaxID=1454010 RepID=UPI000ABDD445|nr:hypothetical protein [Cellulomonas sp. HZM]